MRSLPILLLFAVLSLPQAQASTVEDVLGAIDNAGTAVRNCIQGAPSVAACEAEIHDLAGIMCSPSMDGCFFCVDFTAFEADGSIRPARLVTVDPLGEIVLSWYGYNFDARSHEKVQTGQWEVRRSSSNEIACSAQGLDLVQ